MSEKEISDEIASRMGEQVASDSKLLAECVNICHIYNLTPETLQFKWEASTFSATPARAHETRFTFDSLQMVKQQINRERNTTKTKRTNPRNTAPVLSAAKRKLPAFMTRGQASGASARMEEVSVKAEYLDSGIGASYDIAGSSAGTVSYEGPGRDERRERAYRYMYEKPGERGEVLDDRIDDMAELIRDYYKIQELSDPSASTDTEVIVVGRIVHDQENSSSTAKLTDANIAIESSRMLSNGARVPLRLEPGLKIRGCAQGAGGYGLFPGAIVGLKGRNGGGGWFSASEIIVPPMPIMTSTKRDPSAFSMHIGCGPFTPDTDLDYKPWKTLLRVLKKVKPSVVLLVGPFVDSNHPHIEGGEVDETPLAFFQRIFLEPLSDFLSSSPASLAILVPSVRDLASSHAVFPQSEFRPEVSMHARIKLLPNPSTFSINGTRFSASSVDVLFHLKTQELLKRGEEIGSVAPVAPDDSGSDAMGNLCRHVLQQRSFYPLFPVPLDVSHEVNLDVTHSKGLNLDEESLPDIIILPSKLKQFSKRVQMTRIINPSSALKGVYATLEVAGSDIRAEVLKMETSDT
ncbi:DNA-directed DNA polymerase alpha subunit pol12 [Stygiomarasmius scandens]|uniref:DNA polymerase alpha subunit B n=1 Tax=Marasmiellus scandens TaxID=2682957 RepID=A0ABR1J0S2_9AGAR